MSKPLVVGAVVLASSLFATLAVVAPHPAPSTSLLISQATVTTIHSIGLTEETLAAAGVTGIQATGILSNVAESPSLVSALASANGAADEAAAALTAAHEAARGPFATENSPSEVAAAQAAFETALANQAAARTSLFNAATEGLSGGTKAKLAAAATALTHQVPTAFMVVPRPPEAWTEIEVALRAEARAARMGTELSSEHSSLLTAIRTEEEVLAAQSALENGLASVQAAIATAAAGPGGA